MNWRLLRCGQCGRAETPSAADVAGYARSGWPKCCGQVMSYTSESDAQLSPETPIETARLATSATPARSPRVHLSVLVVDDHRDTAVSQASLLTAGGFDVRIATSGAEAVAVAEAVRPDVILLDIVMPGMNGWEVAEAVRAGGHRPLIVAVSGQGTDPDRAKSAAAGIDLYLVKPVGPAFLLGLVSSVVPAAPRPAGTA